MKTSIRWLIPVALLQVLACSDSVEQPAETGSGGNSSGETTSSSASNGTGGTPEASSSASNGTGGGPETSSSASGDTGGGPVECDVEGIGAPPGTACTNEGEICDNPCSGCWSRCIDGVWVEQCNPCPDALPENGTSCEGHYGATRCSYRAACGTASADCDGATGLWVVEEDGDCDDEEYRLSCG
ncbi:hypothetical protein WMF11_41900 [Sorangium sp. So ce295]|uniref:hypothetical protein n=1 Tax=Sorangium sp. So ce295 TaxID=3133295 RepID=UPI003F636885